jgi:hypothetical protein
MRRPVLLGIVFLAAVLAMVVYSTMNMAVFRVEVCMQYQAKTSCRTAAGKTEMDTLRAAINNACGDIASGVTDTISCQNSFPKSVTWLKRSPPPK